VVKEYILKQKNIAGLTFFMDDISFQFNDLGEIIAEERLPYGVVEKDSKARNVILLDLWLKGRGLPDSRKDKEQVKEQFKVDDLKILAMRAKGLNLTDHYWLHEADKSILWEEVNHFTNEFDMVIQGKDVVPGIDESVANESPNLCVDGSIVKRWIIRNGERHLIKGSRYRRMQEPFNERIASLIMDEFGIHHVNYDLKRTKENIPYSECNCMSNEEIEYLNAEWVINNKNFESGNMHNGYVDFCTKNGVTDAKEHIDEMFAIDFLMGNEDRHRGNFGILRNADTLAWISMAPLFDNGNSLFFDYENEDMGYFKVDSFGKAFRDNNRLNLDFMDYPEWYNEKKGSNVPDIVRQVLMSNKKMSSKRIDKVIRIIKERIAVFEDSIRKLPGAES
jgi:hypothetical protein